jgi:aromatic-L-amino-acid decarboxylase
VEHLATLGEQRASDTEGGAEAARAVAEPLPEKGEALEALLDLYFRRVLPKGYNTASPGTLSYVTGGGLFHAAVAELVAAATNPYVAYWGAAPGCTQIENTVVRWFSTIVGLPETSGGILTSGGSIANLTAITAARMLRFGDEFARGTIYASDQLHHSIRKSSLLAGFPAKNLRVVATNDDGRMDLARLDEAIADDRATGFVPFLVVGTAGTTSTGAVDDLRALAATCRRERLWFHVDAAYGGFFALTERGRAALAGIELADSVVLDPHKSLFLPFGTGCLLARRADDLRRTHMVHSDYIHKAVELGEDASATNPADLSPEMSRDFRGLRVWLPLKLLGARAFRECLDEKLDLALYAMHKLRSIEGVEILAEPQLSTVAFRVKMSHGDRATADAYNRRILERINRRGRVHVSGAIVRGAYAIRICALAFRAHKDAISACLEDLRSSISDEANS